MPIFYSPEVKKSNKKIEISDSEYNHIKNSFRKKTDEKISITNGCGLLAEAYIEKITSEKIVLNLGNITFRKKSNPHIALAFSLLKKNNDLIIEKCTELGIYEFFPFASQRTVKKNYSPKLFERFQKIAISAMKQCDSVYLPKINSTTEFTQLFPKLNLKYKPIIAWENEKNIFLHNVLADNKEDVCLIVGPEGGFANEEIEVAKKHSAKVISLGNHILRGETAAIVMTANQIFYQLQKDESFY